MSKTPEYFAESHSLGRAVEKLGSRWGGLVAYGALSVLFGTLALGLVEASSLAVVFLIALMLIVAGGAEILLGIDFRDWPSFFLRLISGLFYLVFGAFALARPEVAAAALTGWPGNTLIILGTLFGLDLCFTVRVGSHSASGCGADGTFDRRALDLSV